MVFWPKSPGLEGNFSTIIIIIIIHFISYSARSNVILFVALYDMYKTIVSSFLKNAKIIIIITISTTSIQLL